MSQDNRPDTNKPLGAPASPNLSPNIRRAETVHQPGIQVPAGPQLPPAASTVPKLSEKQALPTDVATSGTAIAEGINFQGNGSVQGSCVISGDVVGNIAQANGVQTSITITESGSVLGDIKAHQIVVMGRSKGLLDASSGLVTLQESANVQGHVRYAKLQVNGADLNATLEKSVNPDKAPAPDISRKPSGV